MEASTGRKKTSGGTCGPTMTTSRRRRTSSMTLPTAQRKRQKGPRRKFAATKRSTGGKLRRTQRKSKLPAGRGGQEVGDREREISATNCNGEAVRSIVARGGRGSRVFALPRLLLYFLGCEDFDYALLLWLETRNDCRRRDLNALPRRGLSTSMFPLVVSSFALVRFWRRFLGTGKSIVRALWG